VFLASHEGSTNAWFPIALLVPFVVGPALWLGLSRLRKLKPNLGPLVAVFVVAATAFSLHVSVLTWRHHKDLHMCRSWDGPERRDQCVAARRARAEGPWGIFMARSGD
jgi:hypothetical protein